MTIQRDPRGSDKRILQIMESAPAAAYDSAIAPVEDPAVFRHLSSLRRGLLGWFPFDGGARILEVGAGFGAITGSLMESGAEVTAVEPEPARAAALKKRYAQADRLTVICSGVMELPDERHYDYVVLVRVPSAFRGRESELFARCASLLRPGGILLAGFDNRFGLSRWCGGIDEHAEQPFSAIERSGAADGLYTRTRFTELMATAGLRLRRYFYPLPNALFPQAVYTDESFPADGAGDRVFAFDPWDSPLVLEPGKLYEGLNREGLMPAMADYVLGMFSPAEPAADAPDRGGTAAEIERVILSADRGEKRSFYVRLYGNGRAEKGTLYDAGAPALRAMYENLEELRSRGIPVIDQKMEKGRIVMPRRADPTLLEVLRHVTGPEELAALFDRLRQYILISSPRMSGAGTDGPESVLQTGYTDMIPFNIFVHDGEFLYFDQEFSIPACPVGYILFRALYYSYLHVPALERLIPLEEMKGRYGLAPLWDDYRAREDAFIDEVRRRVDYRLVYRWADIDRNEMEHRREVLGGMDGRSGERRMSAVHRVQKELAQELERLCGELGLRYYAIHGTLLGAVRHHGFIPWDDDMDFVMSRPDYDILVREAPKKLRAPMFLQTEDSDRRCYFGGYARLQNLRTTAMTWPEALHPCSQGIWIDIFPLDDCCESAEVNHRRQARITALQRILYAKYYPAGSGALTGLSSLRMGWIGLAAKCVPGRWIRRRLDRLYRAGQISDKVSIQTCIYGDLPNRNLYDRASFAGDIRLPFEDITLPVPTDYKEILAARYGRNYMALPPAEKRKPGHAAYLDPDTPYDLQDRQAILTAMRKSALLEWIGSVQRK